MKCRQNYPICSVEWGSEVKTSSLTIMFEGDHLHWYRRMCRSDPNSSNDVRPGPIFKRSYM